MGIYSSQALGSARTTVEVEPQYYSESMSIMDTTYHIIAESENNWNTIMKAIGLQELAYLEAYGEEMVYTEGAVSDFFGRMKDWFKKLFAKIKGLYEKFVSKIRSLVSSDSSFVSKYEDKIREGAGKIPSSATFKGYKYEHIGSFNIPDVVKKSDCRDLYQLLEKIDIFDNEKTYNISNPLKDRSEKEKTITLGSNDVEEIDKVLSGFRENHKEELLNAFRATVICTADSSYGNSCESQDFQKDLELALKGDKETLNDDYLKQYDVFINEIKTAKETLRKAKEDFEKAKKNINEAIREIEDLERKIKSDKESKKLNDGSNVQREKEDAKFRDKQLAVCSEIIGFYKAKSEIMTTANGIHINALKAYNRQCKAICVKLVGFANRQSSENASYNYFQSESPVSGIQLV